MMCEPNVEVLDESCTAMASLETCSNATMLPKIKLSFSLGFSVFLQTAAVVPCGCAIKLVGYDGHRTYLHETASLFDRNSAISKVAEERKQRAIRTIRKFCSSR